MGLVAAVVDHLGLGLGYGLGLGLGLGSGDHLGAALLGGGRAHPLALLGAPGHRAHGVGRYSGVLGGDGGDVGGDVGEM